MIQTEGKRARRVAEAVVIAGLSALVEEAARWVWKRVKKAIKAVDESDR